MQKLRELRKARGLTQQQLADKVGISNVSLSNYERGTQMPDILTLTKLANAIGVSTDTLLGLNDQDDDSNSPKTLEARILASGVDKLPKEQRELALNVVKAMFLQYSDFFEKGSDANDPKL